MKKLFIFIALVLMAAISQAQAVKGVVMKDGINAGGKNVSNAEISVLDSAKTGFPIQRQIDKKVGIGSIVDYSATLYTKTEVNSLLSFTVRKLIRTSTRVSHTGNTSKTLLYTGTIPANTLSANSTIYIKHLCFATGTAGSKYCVVEFNNVEVSRVQMASADIGAQGESVLYCRTTTSQVGVQTSNSSSSIISPSAFTSKTYTFDLTQDIVVKLYVTLSNAADLAGWDAFQINYNN